MKSQKKFRGNTLSRLIVIALICIVFFMIYLKNYITAVISGLLLFVVFNDRRKRVQSDLKINNRVAEAMASKIKFEAEQHKRSRDQYNYMKQGLSEEE